MKSALNKSVMINPTSPMKSAKYLMNKAELSPDLRTAALQPLSRWLANEQACLAPVKRLKRDASTAAVQARANGTAVVEFRLSTHTSKRVCSRQIKYLNLATKYAKIHSDERVKKAAQKIVRGLLDGRASWEQTDERLAAMRSLVARRGRRAARNTTVNPSQTVRCQSGKEWRLVTTVSRLEAIGDGGGLCTGSSSPQSKFYARSLKKRDMRFFELVGGDEQFLALVSIGPDGEVHEARGLGNKSVVGEEAPIATLLTALGARVGYCSDLLSIGIADGFEEIDRGAPDLLYGGFRLWKGQKGAVLVENAGKWSLMEPCEDGGFVSRDCRRRDSESMLGALLTEILGQHRSNPDRPDVIREASDTHTACDGGFSALQ